MSKELCDFGFNILSDRLVWDNDQRLFSIMRVDGLPRLNKPFPTAADSHIAVIDNAIRKRKPYLMGQITAGDRLCNFTSMKSQVEAMSDSAADFMDFYVRNYTKFLDEMDCVFDTSCLRGRGVLKVTVDPLDSYAIKFEAIDPIFILMPQEADDFDDADGFVHVRLFTVDSYKRLDNRWSKDASVIAKIRGQPLTNLDQYLQQKRLQEGITNTVNPNQIIVWEHWKKTLGGHTIYTYSPHAPDVQLRKPYGNPYKWQGKELVTYFSIPQELIKGWYAPRGLGRLLAPEEEGQTKIHNEKLDAMTYYNRPVLTSDKEIANSANYRWRPGEVVAPGAGVRQLMQGAPPMSFDDEMYMSKERSEEIAQAPDFGIQQSNGESSKPRTAAENNRISALQQTGTNYLGEIIHRRLQRIYTAIWALIVQFKQREFAYFAAGELKTLPEQAIHESYIVTPDGSPDGWNRMLRFQKSIGLMQATAGNPNVNPEPITEELLNAYDGRMKLKAFVPTNQKAADEMEDQANDILLLTSVPPFPVVVKPMQDHMARIQATVAWIEACLHMKVENHPAATNLVIANMGQHLEMLKQQNPKAAKEVEAKLEQFFQMNAQKLGMGNVTQMPQQPQQPAMA